VAQPEDLGPHRVLDTSNRRFAALVYLAAGLVAVGMILVTDVGAMWLTAVLPLLGIAFYHVVAGRPMRITDMEAIVTVDALSGLVTGTYAEAVEPV